MKPAAGQGHRSTGDRNETDYAHAIGDAQWRVHRRAITWYFLHCIGSKPPRDPSISYRNPETGQIVVSIPATTNDPFWDTQKPMSNTRPAARAAAKAGVDALLSADGRSGLEQLFKRLKEHYGDGLEWTTCSELAKKTADKYSAFDSCPSSRKSDFLPATNVGIP